VGVKACEIDGYKLWYFGSTRARNGVCILVERELVDRVVEVICKSDRIMAIRLVVGVEALNVICDYALQVGLTDDIKRIFWEELEEVVQSVPQSEKVLLGGDFNGHIDTQAYGYDLTYGGFCFGKRNSGGVMILGFTGAFDLTIVNSCFKKKEDHLGTFRSGNNKSQIDYFLIRTNDRRMCKDCKVIPSKCLGAQYKLLVMDLVFKSFRVKKIMVGDAIIR